MRDQVTLLGNYEINGIIVTQCELLGVAFFLSSLLRNSTWWRSPGQS